MSREEVQGSRNVAWRTVSDDLLRDYISLAER
jgi:hypothetical protein